MHTVLQDPGIPDDAGIAIEYQLPSSSKRVDFIVSGGSSLVIIELKQWEKAAASKKPSVVLTYLGGTEREVLHPSYQAWSYAQFLRDFSEVVEIDKIDVSPCALLHNFEDDGILSGPAYKEDIDRAPLFFKTDVAKLRAFIKRWVRHGDDGDLLYRIDQGKIRPSKSLADHLGSLLKGNKEFVLIDDQKLVFESAISIATKSGSAKRVVIVEGGPGTGKSVVAINLLVELTKRGLTSQYVTKNAAPRAVFEARLSGHMKRSQISNMFVGSGCFTDTDPDEWDVLVVDEAHRLNEKSGIFKNLGENQIKELVHSARTTVFFLDESQRVTMHDIGSIDEIRKWAKKFGATVSEYKLESQFRCAGSDGYIAWLDDVLQICPTANTSLEDSPFDFRVFDDPHEMHSEIIRLNKKNRKSRIVAGYCWDWASKKDPKAFDIVIPGTKFKVRWNLVEHGSAWLIADESVSEAGCIHTCQGLELDYVGVVIGPDFVVRDGVVVTDGMKRSRGDQSLKGFKGLFKEDPVEAQELASEIIKNTYRTLLTRGMKGCFLYSTDPETADYFRDRAACASSVELKLVAERRGKYSST